jgi:hypothetical protein
MTFKLYLNVKIILNSNFSIIYLFCRTKKQPAHLKAKGVTWVGYLNYHIQRFTGNAKIYLELWHHYKLSFSLF